MTCRAWCFTWFPKVNEDGETYDRPAIDGDLVKYLVYQGEWSAKGNFHWQGYVEFKNAVRATAVKGMLPAGSHWEKRKGTPEQARAYCMKEESRCVEPVEFGDFAAKKQGSRTDISDAKEKLKEGKWMEIDPGTFVRNHRGLMAYAKLMGYKRKDKIVRDWKTHVTVIVGGSGKGKSKKAWEICGKEDTYFVSPGNYKNVWWDEYDGHDNVIINDHHGEIPFNMLLGILDRYPCKVPTKGGSAELLAKKIVITSTKDASKWYDNGRYNELHRRIDKFIEFEDEVEEAV